MNGAVIQRLIFSRGEFNLEIEKVEIQPGEVLGVMGKSGSGKTSLLQAISGFLSVSSGSIQVNGKEIGVLPPEKRGAVLVFQKPWLFEHQTVLENVCFGLKLQGKSKKECSDLAQQWLVKMEISHLENKRAWEISGGEAQRVALARAMAVHFPLILLDEPFSALDAPLRQGLRKLLKELISESKACGILVSHDWKDIQELAERVLVLSGGRVLALEKVSQIQNHSNAEVRAICAD